MAPMSLPVYRGTMRSDPQAIEIERRLDLRSDNRRHRRAVAEQVARDALHVIGGHVVDALQDLVERELLAEIDLLTRELRHAARRVLEAQHEAAFEMILGALQFRDLDGLLAQAAQLGDREVDH